MAEPVLSVCWKDHNSELAEVYKSLLRNNFLVDCTISAGGQSLKAHRLVLSACSPYFHMLFREETGKHPFVILLDASFETLKAVVDFVYRGEAQIPERNLKAFLTLAQSLQIKGLNAFTQDYTKKNLSGNATGNDPHTPSDDSQDSCDVLCLDDSPENSRQHSHLADGYSDTVRTNTSVSFETYSASCEEVQSTSVMTAHEEQQEPVRYDVVTEDTEIIVKNEPLYTTFSETTNEILDIKSNQPTSGNFPSEMEGGTAFIIREQNLNKYSRCSGSSHGNVESSVITHPQQLIMQLDNEVTSGRNVAEQHESELPVILVPKSERMDDAESEEPIGYAVPTHGEQNLDQCSNADDLPAQNDQATRQRREVRQQRTSSLPHAELQLHEGRRAQRRQETPSGDDGHSFAQFGNVAMHWRSRREPCFCKVCQKAFTSLSKLATHMRKHTVERPYRCDVCGKTFVWKQDVTVHMRTHTGERPYRCEVCGKDFTRANTLTCHLRMHTGERPYHCDMCGKDFSQRGGLAFHKRSHMEEYP